MDPLSSEGPSSTRNAETLRTQLLSIRTLIPTLEFRNSIHRPRRLSQSTQLASKLSLLGLILSVATALTELCPLIKVLSWRAALPAFLWGLGAEDLGHTRLVHDDWTRGTAQLSILTLILAQRTDVASSVDCVEVRSRGTGDAVRAGNNVTRCAGVVGNEVETRWIRCRVRKDVTDVKSILFQNQSLEESFYIRPLIRVHIDNRITLGWETDGNVVDVLGLS
jgi:hypothetical protein